MREIIYRLDVGHNFLKIDASENFYLRPNGDDTQKVFMLPQSYTINCRRLLLRESSLNPQWFLDLLFYVDESDTRKDSEILEEFFKFSSFDVAFDSDNVSSSGQNVFVSGVNGDAPFYNSLLTAIESIKVNVNSLPSELDLLSNLDDEEHPFPLRNINSVYRAVNDLDNEIRAPYSWHGLSNFRKIDGNTELSLNALKQLSIGEQIHHFSVSSSKLSFKSGMSVPNNNVDFGNPAYKNIFLRELILPPQKIVFDNNYTGIFAYDFRQPIRLLVAQPMEVHYGYEDLYNKPFFMCIMGAFDSEIKNSNVYFSNGELHVNTGLFGGSVYNASDFTNRLNTTLYLEKG